MNEQIIRRMQFSDKIDCKLVHLRCSQRSLNLQLEGAHTENVRIMFKTISLDEYPTICIFFGTFRMSYGHFYSTGSAT